jgi:hypothetical protein
VPIIHQLVDNPPERIIFKSLEVLAKITVPVKGEAPVLQVARSNSLSGLTLPSTSWTSGSSGESNNPSQLMNDESVSFALDILDKTRRLKQSRDREVFAALIQLYSSNLHLIGDLSCVVAYMCRLQPPEFVFVSFAVELDNFVGRERNANSTKGALRHLMSQDYQFVSAFIQQMSLVLLNSKEAGELRNVLKDCIGNGRESDGNNKRRTRLFHILLHSFSHNLVAVTSLCLLGGACRTASLFLNTIDPLDINLVFLLELDKLVEMIERPLFRHLHVRMLETDVDPLSEGSGTMLFHTLKCILMLMPQSACYNVLRDRLVSTSRFRQSIVANISLDDDDENLSKSTETFVTRVLEVRSLHCRAIWDTIRSESLETMTFTSFKCESNEDRPPREVGIDRREWLGYKSKEEEMSIKARYQVEKKGQGTGVTIEEIDGGYNDISSMPTQDVKAFTPNTTNPLKRAETGSEEIESKEEGENWKNYWSNGVT